jgi:hypothetical protein
MNPRCRGSRQRWVMNGPKVTSALSPFDSQLRTLVGAARRSHSCRYCCKSLFALVIKNSPGCRRDFRVKMWGTSSPDDKLTADLGNVIETTQIGGRRSDRLTAGKLSPGNFGLLQQYLPKAAVSTRTLRPAIEDYFDPARCDEKPLFRQRMHMYQRIAPRFLPYRERRRNWLRSDHRCR